MPETDITIQPITDLAGCRHVQAVQHHIWQGPEIDLLPVSMLVTFVENGALVLGAFAPDGPLDTEGLVGFLIGWLGTTAQGKLKHCSTVAGVLPGWRGRGVGRQLKLAQREAVLAEGLTEHVTWTYDPLNWVNGRLNIHRLGAISTTYVRNLYGQISNALNAGLPTDRCQVDWWLRSERVERALADAPREQWPVSGLQILDSARGPDGLLHPQTEKLHFDGRPLALPLPDDVATLRQHAPELMLTWRLYLREVLEAAFAAGYTLVDCVQLTGQEWFYILTAQ